MTTSNHVLLDDMGYNHFLNYFANVTIMLIYILPSGTIMIMAFNRNNITLCVAIKRTFLQHVLFHLWSEECPHQQRAVCQKHPAERLSPRIIGNIMC